MSGSKPLIRITTVAAAATLASCGPPPPPPVAPPPPPVQEAFRARPIAPGYAQDNLAVPGRNELGIRQTINTGLTPEQSVWNLRSAYNVAALNCDAPEDAQMAERYGEFLKTHSRELTSTNKKVDEQFRDRFGGSDYKRARDQYMTQVYNYFSLPPALPRFCAAVRETSLALADVPKGDLDEAAQVELPKLELVFLGYFDEYEAYRAEAQAWDSEYLATYGEPYRHRWMVPAPVDPNAQVDPNAAVDANAPLPPAPDATIVPSATADTANGNTES
ncbi:hypothetical protein [Croceicoccus marinus]|uniref:hypothetical protein n=1 Tax=Croceicoccus marinus TaxID=450378 RepID=UPI000A5C2C81|nr:hypothetical protein [Croceicoccus marinus]